MTDRISLYWKNPQQISNGTGTTFSYQMEQEQQKQPKIKKKSKTIAKTFSYQIEPKYIDNKILTTTRNQRI